MHPAPSIIVFTVLSGLGLGAVFWLGLGLGPDGEAFAMAAPLMALLFTAAGGAASVGHLARPERAWRAFSQWRSSWLSREACLLVFTLVVFVPYAAIWAVAGIRLWGLGWLAAGLAAATVYATAMIYASLRTVPRWNLPPTPLLFLVLAALGGLILLEAIAGGMRTDRVVGLWLVPGLLVSAAVVVRWQTQAAGAGRSAKGSTLVTATGLGARARLRPFEPPHTGRNYLLDEMAFRVGRRRAWQLRWIGAGLGFLAPIVLTVLALLLGGWIMTLALVAHIGGMLSLRWLFFAEAEHVQALYYGTHPAAEPA